MLKREEYAMLAKRLTWKNISFLKILVDNVTTRISEFIDYKIDCQHQMLVRNTKESKPISTYNYNIK